MTVLAEKCYRYQGLTVRLASVKGLSAASACLRVEAGSHDEPQQWPGLAHLLEHLLFQGGAQFTGSQRLMPWVTARHGRVNATTEAYSTLFYFDLPAAEFCGGIARLLDMALAPTLSTAAIEREVTVIDAECGLLSRHLPTLSRAFLAADIHSPPQYQRFVVGNRASLGEDSGALRQALVAFHQQYYHHENLTLFLRADLSLPELEQQLVQAFQDAECRTAGGQALCAPRTPVPFPQMSDRASAVISAPGERLHCLSYLLADPDGTLLDSVPLFQALIADAAPGTLRHHWSARGLCHSLNAEVIPAAAGTLWLLISLTADAGAPKAAGQLLPDIQNWLSQLKPLTAEHLTHYARLAAQEFTLLSPMEQLRKLASGQAGRGQQISGFAEALLNTTPRELQSGQISHGEARNVRGFCCDWQPASLAAISAPLRTPDFVFYPQVIPLVDQPPLGDVMPSAPCHRSQHRRPGFSLLMRPQLGTTLTAGQAAAVSRSLAPFFSRVRHAGGESFLSQRQGNLWLIMQLPDSDQAESLIDLLLQCWPAAASAEADDEQQIVIRRLLARFPAMLAQTFDRPRWCCLLQHDDQALVQRIDRRLQQGIAALNRPLAAGEQSRRPTRQHIPATEGDNAVLFFLPLVDQAPQNIKAAQRLASLYQPAFYHWLREEKSVGYVVSCRFERLADRAGILCALQSPQYPCQQLIGWCEAFFSRLSERVEQLRELPAVATESESGAYFALQQELEQKITGSDREVPSPAAECAPLSSLIKLHRHFCQAVSQGVVISYGQQ